MAKRDEMIYAMREADNRFVEAEKLTDYELQSLRHSLVARSHSAAAELDRRDSVPKTARPALRLSPLCSRRPAVY